MNKCANCETEAFYAYLVTASTKINYCKKHIPGFLKSETYSARLVKLEKPAPVEAPKSKKKYIAPEPVVVEEVIIEEETAEVVEDLVEEPTLEVTEAE